MNTMKKVIFFMVTILTFVQCGKRKQYSNWKINGVAYTSNNVEKDLERGRGGYLSCRDQNANFSFYFECTCLPSGGTYPIVQDVNFTPGLVQVTICLNSVCYKVSEFEQKSLSSSKTNKKARYIMPPTWFVKFDDPTDSILVEGTFNEP